MILEKNHLLDLALRWDSRVFLFYLAPSRLEAGAPRGAIPGCAAILAPPEQLICRRGGACL